MLVVVDYKEELIKEELTLRKHKEFFNTTPLRLVEIDFDTEETFMIQEENKDKTYYLSFGTVNAYSNTYSSIGKLEFLEIFSNPFEAKKFTDFFNLDNYIVKSKNNSSDVFREYNKKDYLVQYEKHGIQHSILDVRFIPIKLSNQKNDSHISYSYKGYLT